MSSVVPSATLDTASAPLATNPPAVAQPDDASTTNTLLNGAAAAKGNDSAAVKPSNTDTSTSPSATDSSSTTTPTPPATKTPSNGAAAAKSSAPPPASPTNSDKGSANNKTQGATPPSQKSQDTSTLSNTLNSNSNSNAATLPAGTSVSETSAVATPSDSITPSGTTPSAADSATTAPPTTPTFDGSSISGADTQTQTNARISSPSSSSLPSTNSGTSFSQNKGLVIGLAVAAGLLIALFLIYVIMCCIRSRRHRQLDREMDASFEETMNRWRPTPTVSDHDQRADLRRTPSAMSTASASYAAYTEPPMAVAPQQPNYGFGYAPARQEYWTAAPPPQMSMAMGGAPAMGMGAAPGMMMQQSQSHRGEVHATQTHTQWGSGLVHPPSQSAAIQLAPEPQVQTRSDYLLNYASPAPQDLAGADSPVSPTPMPNPFDSKDERVLKVANE
ncbi:hypothetical protein DFH09DRAFT_1136744 [Mycena vulgaris]|nr:hypothetical protein DFH09DRAFT_1136744 [Mycena vulgaris]